MDHKKQALEKRNMDSELEHSKEMAARQEREMAASGGIVYIPRALLGDSVRAEEGSRIPRSGRTQMYASDQQTKGRFFRQLSLCFPAYLFSSKPISSRVPFSSE